MFKNMWQAVLASLLLFVSLHAQSVSVWTLDEQLSSNNLTVLRFRVQNTGQQTIRGLELHYRVKQEWSGIAPAEGYYIPGGNAEWVQSNNGEALLKISFPNAVLEPMEELSNSTGFSVGLHAKDWSAWNKHEHYSQPASGTFTLTDRIPVYSNGILLAGEPVSNAACPEVWFLEVQTDSVKIGWLPSGNAEEQTVLELRSFHGVSQEVNLAHAADSDGYMEWSGAFPVQHENHGELWLNCSGKMSAYFAYGLVPENAGSAVKAGLWNDEFGFVKASMGLGYNMGLGPGDRFIVEPEAFGRRISDWKLYRAWEAPDLEELPTIAFPGLGATILPETPNDSMLFAWTAVEGFQLYQLHIVRDSAYGDTLLSLLVRGTEVRLPMPPPGIYVWWAEPAAIVNFGLWSSVKKAAKSVGKAVASAVKYTYPVLSTLYSLNYDNVFMKPAFTRPFNFLSPIGIFSVAAGVGDVDVRKKTLNIKSLRTRKDTRMLNLAWGSLDEAKRNEAIDNGWWDSPKDSLNPKKRWDDSLRCWSVTAQMLSNHFGGTVTQDEIAYHVKSPSRSIENHFPMGDDMMGYPLEAMQAIHFALNISTLDYLQYYAWLDKLGRGTLSYKDLFTSMSGWYPSLSPYEIIANIEAGIPMAVSQVNHGYKGMHIMVIDGYRIQMDGSVYLHYLNTDNNASTGWRYYATFYGSGSDALLNMIAKGITNLAALPFKSLGMDFSIAYYVPPANAKGRLTDSRVHEDTDDDGIVNFDEIMRFGTNPEKSDSDGDGIPDKKEIAYYIRLGISADVDVDGLRAELDIDSDGDGDCDGDENANKDNRYDKDVDETNMMDPSSVDLTRRNCMIKPVALLAAEQISINDRAYCTDGSDYCPIVSMGLGSGHAAQLGVSAKVGSILAGSSVWLRSNAYVSGDVHSAGALFLQNNTHVLGTTKQNDSAVFRLAQAYRPLLFSFKRGMLSGDMHISSGQTVLLQPGSYMQNIVVSSGSVLRLRPGNYKMGSLTVQSGGKIELQGSDKIALDIDGSFRWDGTFQRNSIQDAASRLQIRVLSSQDIFLNTSFGGFLVAPNAYVVVGQADKDYAGQIYARRITLHQNTRFQWIPPGGQQNLINIAAFNRGAIYAYFKN